MPVTVERRGNLIVVRFTGETSAADLADAAELVDDIERETPGLPRLVATTEMTGVQTDFVAVARFSGIRRQRSLSLQVKTAVVASSNVAFRFARMYQGVSRHSRVTTEVFRDRQDALAWLGVTEQGGRSSVGS
jgi:hypothetical protein